MNNTGSAEQERTREAWRSWVLDFAQSDLERTPGYDWLNVFQEAMAFAASHDESAHAQLPLTMCGPRTKHNLSLKQVKACLRFAQKSLRTFLRDVEQSLHTPLRNAEIPFRGTCVFFLWAGHPEVRYLPAEKTLAKQLATEMCFRLGELFLRGALSQLRRCSGCHRLFLGGRHRRFDTPECRAGHRLRLLKRVWDRRGTR